MNRRSRLWVLLFLSSGLTIAFSGLRIGRPVNALTAGPLPPMSLTVVGANGTQIVLNETDIGSLPSFTSEGGFKTSAGSLRGIGNYTGVQLTTFLALVGGMNSDYSLLVSASDGYSMVYTYNQVQGENFTAYNPATGDELPATQPFTVVLAYFTDGLNLTSGDGPLRLAILGAQGLLTDGHYWTKMVVKMELRPAVVDWTLFLKGALVENMTRGTFESGVNENCHGLNWTDSNNNVWTGIPLWLLVGRVDDGDVHTTNTSMRAFNDTLALQGYTVRVITALGYSYDFNSTTVMRNANIVVADRLNGAPLPDLYWPLRLVGSGLTSSEMLSQVVEIDIVFTPSTPEFPSLTVLALLMIVTLSVVIACRRKPLPETCPSVRALGYVVETKMISSPRS